MKLLFVKMSIGYIYCFSCPDMPGIVKIGMTLREPDIRLGEANKSNTFKPPSPYIIDIAKKVKNPLQKEHSLHTLLDDVRVKTSREFFKITLKKVGHLFAAIDGQLWILKSKKKSKKKSLKTSTSKTSTSKTKKKFKKKPTKTKLAKPKKRNGTNNKKKVNTKRPRKPSAGALKSTDAIYTDANNSLPQIGDRVSGRWFDGKKRIAKGILTSYSKIKFVITLTDHYSDKYSKGSLIKLYPNNCWLSKEGSPKNWLHVGRWRVDTTAKKTKIKNRI